MVLALAYNLGSKSGLGALPQVLIIVLYHIHLLLDRVKFLYSNIACFLKAISYLQWVNALVKQLLRLLENSSSEYDDASGTVADFVVLGGRELYEQSSGLVVDLNGY